MASDDRKRRIMEHLARSSENSKVVSPKKSIKKTESIISPTPVTPPTTEPSPIVPKASDRKRQIMDHLNRSTENFGSIPLDSDKRKKRIWDHIRLSQD